MWVLLGASVVRSRVRMAAALLMQSLTLVSQKILYFPVDKYLQRLVMNSSVKQKKVNIPFRGT